MRSPFKKLFQKLLNAEVIFSFYPDMLLGYAAKCLHYYGDALLINLFK